MNYIRFIKIFSLDKEYFKKSRNILFVCDVDFEEIWRSIKEKDNKEGN